MLGVLRNLRTLLALCVILAVPCFVGGQGGATADPQPQTPSKSPQPAPAKEDPSANSDSAAAAQDADSKSAESKPNAVQTKITPQQAEQLFHDVDTILDFASKDSSLEIKHGVKRRLTSREEVV